MRGVEVEVTFNNSQIEHKIESLIDDTTMERIHQVYSDMINPWIPYKTGLMSENVIVSAEGIDYIAEYAKDQYTNPFYHHTTDPHPLATMQWDKVAMETIREDFCNEVKNILVERAKELYG